MSDTNTVTEGGSWRARVTSASAWSVANTVGSQLIRFGSNLLLTRLLFPEAFGLMALVHAILQGLQMFADFGVGPAVVQARNAHPRLLDVAWTLHIVRGWILFGVLLLIAYPIALWYEEPQLTSLVPAIGIVVIIRGYASSTQFIFERDLRARELLYLEIGSQCVAFVVSAITAVIWRSVWALVFGNWAGAITYTVLSYALDRSHKHSLCWDKEALASIAQFGRWVMASTVLTYLLHHGDRLILASFMSFAQLALYQIALVISQGVSLLTEQLSRRVLFPVYAEVGRETTPLLLKRIRKIRLALMGALLPISWVLACFGDLVVDLLWDPRYHGAGWMVRVLSAGAIFGAFRVGPLHMARGEPWIGFAEGVFHACLLFPSMWIAGSILGPDGLIIAIAASPLMIYLFMIWVQVRYRVWMPLLDVIGIAASAVAMGGGLWLRAWLGL